MADLMLLNSFSNIIIPFLNETFRLIVFLIITYIIFELKKALEKHKELARTDPLTLVANRRAFFELADLVFFYLRPVPKLLL
jgi:predicted signal transduction protein with EAL and GGDEF domain